MYEYLMAAVGDLGYYSANLIANFWCPIIVYQGKEPEAVKKLRKF